MYRRVETNSLYGRPAPASAYVFDSLVGIQVRADVVRPYNTHGISISQVGPVAPEAFEAFKTLAADLQRFAGRVLDAIVVCSVWRAPAEGRPTRHAEGLAMDIGGIWFSESDGITAFDYGARRKQAVAVEAVLRMNCGTVLGPTANKAHLDHWHVDVGKSPRITMGELAASASGHRRVEVVYLQEACSVVHGLPCVLDGAWGPETARAVIRVLRSVGYGPLADITHPSTYRAFLEVTALVGFGHLERSSVD